MQLSIKKNELLDLCKEESNDNLLSKLIKRLISIIKINNSATSEQAAMCLEEIGPLRCANTLYCFDVDNDLYVNCEKVNGVQLFIQSLFTWLERCILNYDPLVDKTAINISHQLVNFAKSKPILSEFRYFKVFEVKMKTVFDNASHLNEIDFVKILMDNEEVSSEKFICIFVADIFAQFSWEDCDHLAKTRGDFSEQCFIAIFQLLLDNKEKHIQSILKLVSVFNDSLYFLVAFSLCIACPITKYNLYI